MTCAVPVECMTNVCFLFTQRRVVDSCSRWASLTHKVPEPVIASSSSGRRLRLPCRSTDDRSGTSDGPLRLTRQTKKINAVKLTTAAIMAAINCLNIVLSLVNGATPAAMISRRHTGCGQYIHCSTCFWWSNSSGCSGCCRSWRVRVR